MDAWRVIGDFFTDYIYTPLNDFWVHMENLWFSLTRWGRDTWETIGGFWDEYIGSPISTFFAWMGTAWDKVTTNIGTGWGLIDFGIDLAGDAWDFILKLINDPISVFTDLGNSISTWASSLGDTFAGLLKAPINALIGLVNSFFDAVDFSISIENPFTGTEYSLGLDLSDWQIPELAKGGIVNKPTLAMIGEDGPEAVIPLSQRNNPQGVGMGGGTFNITVNAGGITDRTDKRSLAREIGNMIQQEMARNIGGATMRGRY